MKKEYLIIIFILLGPFLDVASFLGLPFSILLRGIYLLAISCFLILKKKEIKLLFLLFGFSTIYFLIQVFSFRIGIIASLSAILKFLYLPVSILYFKDYIFPVDKKKIFSMVLLTYVGIYLLSYVFKIGANAYLETDGKSGFKGLFSSINEFSAILVGLLPIVLDYFQKMKKYWVVGGIIISVFIISLLIGTKILMAGILFSVLYLLWQKKDALFFSRRKIEKVGIIIFSIFLLVGGGFLFTKTRTYHNMMVQQEFFQVENIFSLEFINRIVYNDRLTFLKDNFDYYRKQNVSNIFFGIGMNNSDVKMVEIDIFDIWFRYGIVGMILFVGSILYLIDFKKMKKIDKISFLLFLFISLTSGHVFIYPAVCIYMALL